VQEESELTIMTYILGLSGSLRRASFNSMLLDAAAQLAPAGTTVEIGSIRGIPLYDGDVEATEGFPTAVQELKKKVTATDGLLIVTPEYNNSMPGVLKNAIDWLSRPFGEIRTVFGGRPVAVIGATLGQGGTTLAQTAWLPVLRTLGTLPWFGGRLMVSDADEVFDKTGKLIDETTKRRLTAFMAGFAEFISERRR
jgi:chromate reductase, NAD(P)H dehydrogenase (quinone)